MLSSEDVLQHVGIKGMKWGVIRNRNRPGGADGKEESTKVKDNRSKLSVKISSMNRERQWKKVLEDVDKLNTKDITAVTKRITLENDLKRLTKSGSAKSKDKDDYLRRDKMSDAELTRKVTRLRAKENLAKSVKEASKEQREFGEKLIQIGGSVGVKYALTRTVPGPKDLFDIYKKPKESYDGAKEDLQAKALEIIRRNA
jgi:hypothetical protein